MTLHCSWRDMMREAAQRLAAAGVENAPREARLLLAHALGIAPVEVILRETDAIDIGALTDFEKLSSADFKGEPVSRIRGWREFYGRHCHARRLTRDPKPNCWWSRARNGCRTRAACWISEPARGLHPAAGPGGKCPDAIGTGLDTSPPRCRGAQQCRKPSLSRSGSLC